MHVNSRTKVKLPQIGKLSSTGNDTRSRLNSIQFSSATALKRRLRNQIGGQTATDSRSTQQGLKLIDLTDVLEVFDLVKKSPD